jgi:hypothetical protein
VYSTCSTPKMTHTTSRRPSYSLGQFHYQTKGFRPNNDLRQDVYNVFLQGTLSQGLSTQVEARHRDLEHGDLLYNFDLRQFDPVFRRRLETNTIRWGANYSSTPGVNLIASLIHSDVREQRSGSEFSTDYTERGFIGEAQSILDSQRFDVVLGVGHYHMDKNGGLAQGPYGTDHTNGYAYFHVRYPEQAIWILGVSFDSLNDGLLGNHDQVNPKFGLLWNLTPDTTLRLAGLRTLKRSLLIDQTIEPTQVTGFNQFFDGWAGTDARQYGIAIDHRFSSKLQGGIEASMRNLRFPLVDVDSGVIKRTDQDEYVARAYINWTPSDHVSIDLKYELEFFDFRFLTGQNVTITETHLLPLAVRYFHPSGFLTLFRATYVNQSFLEGEENTAFVLADLGLGYRLPRRYGIIRVAVNNVLDHNFSFFGSNGLQFRTPVPEETPLFVPERTFLLQVNLAF